MPLCIKPREKGIWRRAAGPVLFAISAGLACYVVFHGTDAHDILPVLGRMQRGYVLAAVAAALFFVAAEGWMIWYLLHAVDQKVRLAQCIRYSFVGFFFSGITPSATGGQPVQLYFMNRDGIRTGDGTAVLMAVAAAYKFVLAAIGALMLLFWHKGLSAYLGSYLPLYILGLLLNILLVAVLVGLMCGSGTMRLIRAGERLLVRLRILKFSAQRIRKLEEMGDNYHATVRFFTARKRKMAVVVLVTLLQRSSIFLLTWLIYRGMHLTDAGIWLIMALQAAVTIAVDMLPLPGAQGISEVVYAAAFTGIFPAGLLTPSLCAARGISFYFLLAVSAAAVGIGYLNYRKKKSVFVSENGNADRKHNYLKGGR